MIRFHRDTWRTGKTSMKPSMSLGTSISISIIVVVLVVYALVVVYGFRQGGKGGLIAALFASPFAGVAITPALLAFVLGYLAWVHERVWKPWQGRYYAFDDHQIRVVEARGRLWFASKDVHAVLGMQPRAALLAQFVASERRRDDAIGDALSNAGLVRLLGRSTDAQVLRFLSWAERDVRGPWQKKRDREMVQNPDA